MEPEANNFAMRIKHLLTWKQNSPPLKSLGTYWLTVDIHNFSKEF